MIFRGGRVWCSCAVVALAAQLLLRADAAPLWPFKGQTLPSPEAQFEYAQSLESEGRYAGAMDAYQRMVDDYTSSPLAAEAQFKVAEMLEKTRHYYPAFNAYQAVLDKFPSYPKVNLILARQFKIGNLFLQGTSVAFLKINPVGSYKRAIAIFSKILSNAPFSDLAPNAQYNLGMAYMYKKDYVDAAIEFEKVPARYPQSEFVSQAKYQLGVCAHRQASSAQYDQEAAQEAINKLNDFIEGYPSDKNVELAKEMLTDLQGRKAGSLYQIGIFYQQKENPKAALIYLHEVIRDYPLTRYAEKARKTAVREEKKLEIAEAIRQAQEGVDEIQRLIESQRGAIAVIRAKGHTRWRFWRYLIPRRLSPDEQAEIAEREQKIRSLRERVEIAALEIGEKKAIMQCRLSVLRAEADIEQVEEDLRVAQVDHQVAQSRFSEIGEIPETEAAVMETAAGEIAEKEELVRSKEAQIEQRRSTLGEITARAAEEEQRVKEYYRQKREALSARLQGRDAAVPAGGAGAVTERARRWWWPFGGRRENGQGEALEKCEMIYRDAVELVNGAERKRLERSWPDALDDYDHASLNLMQLKKLWPEYREREVDSQLRACRAGIEEARQQSAAQQYAELLKDLQERLVKNPYDVETYTILGQLYLEHDETDKAIEAFEKAVSLTPGTADMYRSLGVAYLGKGNMERAAASLGRAAEMDPHDAAGHYHLGVARRELGDYEGAREAFERAVREDASYAPPYFSLGQLYRSIHGEREKAVRCFSKYLELQPDDPRASTIAEWMERQRVPEARENPAP